MKNPFNYVVMLIAAIPGLAGILGQIVLPEDQKWIFNGLTTIVPPLLVLMLMMFREEIYSARREYLVVYGLIGLTALIVLLIVFILAYSHTVIVTSNVAQGFDRKPVLFPFQLDEKLEERVKSIGGRQAFVDEYGPDTAVEQIARMPGVLANRSITVVILALFLVGFSSATSVTFALFWFVFTKPNDETPPGEKPKTDEPKAETPKTSGPQVPPGPAPNPTPGPGIGFDPNGLDGSV
jgi:hypothetical protein